MYNQDINNRGKIIMNDKVNKIKIYLITSNNSFNDLISIKFLLLISASCLRFIKTGVKPKFSAPLMN